MSLKSETPAILLRDIQLQAIDSCFMFRKVLKFEILNLIDMFTCLFTVHNESMEMPNNFFISKNIHRVEMACKWNARGNIGTLTRVIYLSEHTTYVEVCG